MSDIFKDEKDKLLDHEYDGIRELDNHMPSWWVYGFYFTIAYAVVYLFVYEVTDIGATQAEEYENEIAWAQEYYNLESPDENQGPLFADATFLTAEEDIAKGKELYFGICQACHGNNGEGMVGPNMTDEYWIYGCDAPTIMRGIKSGYPQKGMAAYGGGKSLNETELQQLASYIISLQGTNPANPKPIDPARETECDPFSSGDTEAESEATTSPQ